MNLQTHKCNILTQTNKNYYLTFIDSTHFYSSFSPNLLGAVFHIDEFFDKLDSNYQHVKQWLRLTAQTELK